MEPANTEQGRSAKSAATPRVAVVIRCRNEEAHIGRLLTGIVRQGHAPHEIIVVDSGSTDATLSIASAYPVKIIQIAPEEFSFGAACNRGLESCESDVAIFVSAHCYPVYDSWIEHLVAPFADDAIALTYGRQVGPTDARISEKQIFKHWFPEKSVARQEHPFCNNANAAIRLSVWRDGLRYDESLTGLEDLDWAKRALDAGGVIAYVAIAPIVHVHDEKSAQIINRYQREAIAHGQIYGDQGMRVRQAVRLAAVNMSRDIAAAREEHTLTRSLLDIARFRGAQFYGTYKGFAQTGPVTETLKRRFYFPERPDPDDLAADQDVGEPIDYDESGSGAAEA